MLSTQSNPIASQSKMQKRSLSSLREKPVKTTNSLPFLPNPELSSFEKSKTRDKSRKNNHKPLTMGKIHKMITDGKSLDGIAEGKDRVTISIKRTDPLESEIQPRTPRVRVTILNRKRQQPHTFPKKTTENIIEDDTEDKTERKLLFDEWKFIPQFNQEDFLRQLDSKSIRSLRRTRAWLQSIPLEATDYDGQ